MLDDSLTGTLQGLRVIDFSTLLPGPVCTLMLAACGADVIKVERPGVGDEMRAIGPECEGESLPFAMLNAGKRSVALDLKDAVGREKALELIRGADVLVEQFRPGVMAGFGFDYASVRTLNPLLIYCSITGYGQTGPLARVAGHDLNYAAITGMLTLNIRPGEKPTLPHVPLADVAAGSYPALINILLGLQRRDRVGRGVHLDVNMSEGLSTLMYGAMASVQDPDYNDPKVYSGGSARYRIYETSDERFLAVAAVEERFWRRFCELVGIPPEADPNAVARAIASRTASEWERLLDGEDVCCTLLRSVESYVDSALFRGADRRVAWRRREAFALPLPLASEFLASTGASVGVAQAGMDIEWLAR